MVANDYKYSKKNGFAQLLKRLIKEWHMFRDAIKRFNSFSTQEKRAVLAALFTSTALVAMSIAPIVVESIKTSPSFTVTGGLVASLGGEKTSLSYRVGGVMTNFAMGIMQGTSYRLGSGIISEVSTEAVAVQVTSITPSVAYNTGILNDCVVTGTGFQNGATVTLVSIIATSERIEALTSLVESATKITCNFDLTGRNIGNYNVVVVNGVGTAEAVLASGFELKSWATLGYLVNYPNPFNPANGESTSIIYQLTEDADTMLLLFNISAELIYKMEYMSGANGGKAGDNNISWNGYNSFGELSANGVYFARLVDRRSGRVLAKGKIAVLK